MPGPPRFRDVCARLLRDGVAVRFTATGSSMSPAIRDGDVLTVSPARADTIATGEVVVYLSPEGVVAHRVVASGPGPAGAFQARGDAPLSEEETVTAERLLGRVVGIERGGGAGSLRSVLVRRLRRLVLLFGRGRPSEVGRAARLSRQVAEMEGVAAAAAAGTPLATAGRGSTCVRGVDAGVRQG